MSSTNSSSASYDPTLQSSCLLSDQFLGSSRSSSPRTPSESPPPPILQCDDFGHCVVLGHQVCDIAFLRICPGLPNGQTPLSHNGSLHPQPTQVVTCGFCMQHDDTYAPLTANQMLAVGANTGQYSGILNQLCHDCIRDEVELYWARQGTFPPAGAHLSTANVVQWPVVQNTPQNLCVCDQVAIRPFAQHCHACRDEAFEIHSRRPYQHAEDILRTRTRSVITGRRRCALNGGTAAHRVQARPFALRLQAGIGPYVSLWEHAQAAGAEWAGVYLHLSGLHGRTD